MIPTEANLPEALASVRTRPLFAMRLDVSEVQKTALAVGIGHRPPDGPVYSLFEVL